VPTVFYCSVWGRLLSNFQNWIVSGAGVVG
jgi:hypothetical protein